jgi:flagellin-specific chaperone FliS
MNQIEELCRQIIDECETLDDCINRAEEIKKILQLEDMKNEVNNIRKAYRIIKNIRVH